MLIIHHLGISVSERAVWLCEELGIEYELKRYLRDPKTRLAPKEYKALHPSETSPVIEDGKVCLSESGAIVEYILNKYANSQQIEQITYSKDDEEYADYIFFKHFADASIHENVMLNGTVMRLAGGKEIENETMKSLIGRLSKAYELLEKQLIKQQKSNSKFIVGNKFTLADLLLFFPISTMRNFLPFPKTLDEYPNVKAYVNTIGQLPSYQRTIKRADPERDFLVKL